MRMNKRLIETIFSLLALLFTGCGLEDFAIISNINNIDYKDVYSSTIVLPSNNITGYGDNDNFSRFRIFYRIYISNFPEIGKILDSIRMDINSELNRDYLDLVSYTNETVTGSSSGIDKRFYDKNYYDLSIEDDEINTILGPSSRGKTLIIDFPALPGEIPVLYFLNDEENKYPLIRANSKPNSPTFFTKPENSRYFSNHPEIYDNENAKSDVNADTQKNDKEGCNLTYVSMYIIGMGLDGSMPPKPIYSQASFIGIFKLPDAF